MARKKSTRAASTDSEGQVPAESPAPAPDVPGDEVDVTEEDVVGVAEEDVTEEDIDEEPTTHPVKYMGYPGVAERTTILVADEVNNQKWYSHLAGQEVEVLRIVCNIPHLKGPAVVYVYDGDGSGTKRFIEGTGMSHKEIEHVR